MGTRKCGCVYADAKNSPDVRSGHELGGYLKNRCTKHQQQFDEQAREQRPPLQKTDDETWEEYITRCWELAMDGKYESFEGNIMRVVQPLKPKYSYWRYHEYQPNQRTATVISALCDAYAACNGEDNPAYCEARRLLRSLTPSQPEPTRGQSDE